MALGYDQALSEIAKAGKQYNDAMARGDRAAADAAHSYAQNIRSIAGIQGDGRTKTGLEGTSYAPKIEQLAQVKMQQSQPSVSQQPKIVRDTPYFVEQQFDPRRYEMPKFEEPVATLPGHMVTPALKQAAMQEWLQKVGVRNDERAFDYGVSQDAYARRDAEKKYNEAMALGFSERYGVPIKPMGSLDNLFAQVKGIKPLDVQKMEQDQQYRYDAMGQDNYWKQKDQTYRYDNLNADQAYRYDSLAQDNYWRQQDLALKEQEINKKMLEEKDQFVKEEVTGMMSALRNGDLTPQQAMAQIQQDAQAGTYTPEQKAKLEKVLQDYYYTTTPEQGGAYGPPNLSGFNDKQKGGGYNNYYKTQKSAKANPQAYQSATRTLLQAMEQTGVPQNWLPALLELTARESSWNPSAKNPSSSARGLFQFLDSTRKNYAWNGVNWNDPVHQSIAGIRYVKDRYGTPEQALAFWDKNKWY